MDRLARYDLEIHKLREKWKNSPISLRPIIQRQARAIEIARNLYLKKYPQLKIPD